MSSIQPNLWITLGSLFCLVAVGLGAYGSHGLSQHADAHTVSSWSTAVQYLFIHALAMIACGIIARFTDGGVLILCSGIAFCIGILFFSGSIFIKSLTPDIHPGIITPTGGMFMMLGWLLLAISAFQIR